MTDQSGKFETIDQVNEGFKNTGYICSTDIATTVYLAFHLEKPVLVEGPAGVGKTELAKKAAAWDTAVPADTKIEFNARMLRLRQELTQEGAEIAAGSGQLTQRFLHLQRVYNSNARFLGTSLQKLHIMAKGARKSTDVEVLANDILTRIEKTNANMDLVEQRAMSVNWNDNNQVAKFYREYVKPSMVELLDEYRYINMLSSPRTHLINAHSNLLQAAIMAPATKAVAYGPGEAGYTQQLHDYDMAFQTFFDRLAAASAKNVITPIDIFVSASGRNKATAYFQYDWTVRDGTLITFKVMDLFTFEPSGAKVTYLELIYDTHPIRESAGNKYEL